MSETEKTSYKKKLIEVALPLPEINDASVYDKMPGIGPHPKGIHHWWARLPLPVARAVLFASIVDDPSAHPESFPTDEAQVLERERLFGIIRRMMWKQLHQHPEVYAEAREEMLRHCDGLLPAVLDPFAGGGSIPLEAARLGLEAWAGDLNPVAVLLNKCNLEFIPHWVGRAAVNPQDRQGFGGTESWSGAAALASDVRHYGRVVLEQARDQISHLYPSARVTADMAQERPELRPCVGSDLPVIAWIWARTVASPDPAARGAHVPLMSTFWLSSKKESAAWLTPLIDRDTRTWRFRVDTGTPVNGAALGKGTKTGKSGFRCLITGTHIPFDYVRTEGKHGRIGTALVAVVAQLPRGRVFLPATDDQARRASCGLHVDAPNSDLPAEALGFRVQNYGITKHREMFTERQLTGMVVLSGCIKALRAEVRRDAVTAGLVAEDADAYATTVVTFLALALDRCADFNCALSTWKPSGQQQMHLFGRQAIPMVWDFAEANLLGDRAICWRNAVDITADAIEAVAVRGTVPGSARQHDAASPWAGATNVLVSTDPPYYDNVGYSDLSDFFYVWLRRTIGDLHSDLFQTILVPKSPELVAASERFGGDRREARDQFESGFRRAFAELRENMDQRFPLTVYYAFKQDDEDGAADETDVLAANDAVVDRTTGWETMLEALISTGFQITSTWPVRASQAWRMRAMGANALASYIVLACRPRPADAMQSDRRSFVGELKRELPIALKRLQQGNIAPVDLAQAAIGPGMAIYSRFGRVLESNGKPMSVRTALGVINQVLTEVLSEQEDEFDPETRWAVAWFDQHGFDDGDFGDAELLSKAKVTSVASLHHAGLVRSQGGKVRLWSPDELAKDWNPATDRHVTVWEMTHHLLRVYYHEKAGDLITSEMLRKMGSRGYLARDLAYRLFSFCEKNRWSREAQAYNALVLGWPEIERFAVEGRQHQTTQSRLFTEKEE